MSSGIIILIASSTAAAVIIVAVVLSRVVRTVVHDPSGLVPDLSRARRQFRRRSRGPWLGVRSVADGARAAAPRPEGSGGADSAATASEERAVPSQPGAAVPYRQVGEEVTAVLTAAEHAAAQIREAALRETERMRREAEEQAAAIVAEVEARRGEADDYSEQTRAAADAYAEQARRRTDEIAARKVSEAEEKARLVRAEAEQKGRDLVADAVRRRDALAESAELMEGRIESMLTAFRRASGELEELLPSGRQSGDDEPAPPTDVRLDEALKPVSSQAKPVSHADS